jgi:hypothetical protein
MASDSISDVRTKNPSISPFQQPPLDEIMAVGMATGMATLAGISDYFKKMQGGGVGWRQIALDGATRNGLAKTRMSTVGDNVIGFDNLEVKTAKKLRFHCDPPLRKLADKPCYKGKLKNPYKKPTPAQLYHRNKMREEYNKRVEHVQRLKKEQWAKHLEFLKEQEKEKFRSKKIQEDEEKRKEKEMEEFVRNFTTQRE